MSTSSTTAKMTYRFLGNSGLIVSKFGLGSWMPYYEKYTVDASEWFAADIREACKIADRLGLIRPIAE
ncbi:hypothetical protein L915_21509 [Phytophthora nicotianae]|uniref:NADP-dependent oxidoreductase domain-containing protein n=1 Tax=Phytophthora nicotianae TaxID=4792 RepID=W2FMB3_PHYNI|nr:hypothetical protein L915_21509 [Phytophthora nicotianae]